MLQPLKRHGDRLEMGNRTICPYNKIPWPTFAGIAGHSSVSISSMDFTFVGPKLLAHSISRGTLRNSEILLTRVLPIYINNTF